MTVTILRGGAALQLAPPELNVTAVSLLFAFSIGSLSICIGDISIALCASLRMPRDAFLVTSGTNCYYF